MARKRKGAAGTAQKYYVVTGTGPLHDGVTVCKTLEGGKVACHGAVLALTGDADEAARYMAAIDGDFQTPPYPGSIALPSVDPFALEELLKEISGNR